MSSDKVELCGLAPTDLAQALDALAHADGISVDPTKTLEQLTAQAIRGSQINRPVKGSKKVQPA